jgi:hypothetical protein
VSGRDFGDRMGVVADSSRTPLSTRSIVARNGGLMVQGSPAATGQHEARPSLRGMPRASLCCLGRIMLEMSGPPNANWTFGQATAGRQKHMTAQDGLQLN